MAGKTSKNQRVVKGVTHEAASGISTVITPLNKGRHAYVSTGSKTLHVATDSEAFIDAIRSLDAKHLPKVTSELEKLNERFPEAGWDATLARLRSAEVL